MPFSMATPQSGSLRGGWMRGISRYRVIWICQLSIRTGLSWGIAEVWGKVPQAAGRPVGHCRSAGSLFKERMEQAQL